MKFEEIKLVNTLNTSPNALNDKSNAQMSAVEVVRWLAEADCDTLSVVLNRDNVPEALYDLSAEQIVEDITAYEAAKKAPKPVEVEEGWRIEVYEENGDLWNRDSFWFGYTKEEVESIAKRVAMDCVRQTGKLATWSVINACKVKEDK